MHAEAVGGDTHVTTQRVENPYRVATGATGLNQTAGGIELAVAGEDGEFHHGDAGRRRAA
ncbi:hypothetical protein D3C77_792210 [compost metagenome]